jgi:lipoprotein-anchoring transpeptidase ErfK/SrfK
MKKLTLVAATIAMLAGLVAVPATASASQRTDEPTTNQVHGVQFTINNEPLIKDAMVAAGSDLKIRNVPSGAEVFLQTVDEPVIQLPIALSTRLRRTWVFNNLAPSHRYWVRVLAADGSKALIRFSTEAATNTFGGVIRPLPDSTKCKRSVCKYGVGVPIRIEFAIPIADKFKAAVEAGLSVTSAKPIGPSSWGWINDTTIGFRPRNYWPANNRVGVQANLSDVQGAEGVWGKNFSMRFETGPKVIMRTRIAEYKMVIWQDDKKIKTFPISSGRAGLDTTSGIKVISEKYGYQLKVLWNPEPKKGWKIRVDYALRITWDGEFIHSAPWNNQLGEANRSHGCTNMSTADSKWLFQNIRVGDVVEADGSPVKVANKDVYGFWNYTWPQWQKMSALSHAKAA